MSINEIMNHTFKQQRGGSYKSAEVDSFFAEVKTTIKALTEAYEKAKKDNDELYRKMNILADKIDEYRKDEDNIRAALITAQRMSESVISEANSQAKFIIEEAKKQADETTGSLKKDTDDYVIEQKNDADLYAAKLRKETDEYHAQKTAEADELYAKAKSALDEKTAEAEAKAKAIIEKAESEAAKVISDCEEKKAEIIAKANTQSDEIVANTQARIENSQKKLDELKAMTAQFKAGVEDILKKEIELLGEIKVSDSDYSAEYYPTSFSIDADAVYRPELTVEEENTEAEISDDGVTEEDVQIVDEEPTQETAAEDEATEVIPQEEKAEAAEAKSDDEPEVEEVEIDDEDVVIDGEQEQPKEEAKPEPKEEEPEADYYEQLMKELAEEKDKKLKSLDEIEDDKDDPEKEDVIEEVKSESAETKPDTRNVFTKLDLSDGLDDDEDDDDADSEPVPSGRVDLSGLDGKQLRFGKDYDIFDEEEETQGSFFSKFKKK